MHPVTQSLRDILNPTCVAVVGASADNAKFGGRVMQFLVQHGYAGRIVPVHPTANEILGVAACRRIADAPTRVDVALLAVPASALQQAVEDCGAAGVRCCVIISAEFAEAGAAGAMQQDALVRSAQRHGMRLIGPNCLGYINPSLRLALTSSVALADAPMPRGPVGLVSQSGSLMASLISHARDLGAGFTAAVSVGNQADLEICDFIEYFIDDDSTTVICAYIEGLVDPSRFLELAERARAARKPLMVVKAGQSAAGSASVRSHTASLAGSHNVFEAACRERAVCVLDDPESLIHSAAVFARFGIPLADGVAAFSPSGGTAAVIADRIVSRGFAFAALAPATETALRRWIPEARPLHPLDIGGLPRDISMDSALAAFDAYAADPQVGMILVAVATTPSLDEKVRRWAQAALRARKPAVFLMVPGTLVDGARAHLRALGVPYVNRLDDALRVMRTALDYRKAVAVTREPGPQPHWCASVIEHCVALAAGTLNEPDTKALLRVAGIPTTSDRVAPTADAAVAAAQRIGYPVVLKGLCAALSHKSDIGAVRLALRDADSVRAAFGDIERAVVTRLPGANVEGCVVQNHVTGGIEFLVGARWDPQFGAIVAVGAGGTLVELLDDVALATAPVAQTRAVEMLQGLRASRLLEGLRGMPRADRDALVDAIVRVSWLAAALGPRLVELDINPLAVLPAGRGVIALDARATLAPSTDRMRD